MLIIGGQFGPKQGGQFALKKRGHFAAKCRGQFGRNIHYDAGQRQQLLAIAYQSPYVGGEAVYRARAILNLDIDDTQFAYRLADVDSSTIRELFIYPNPSRGKFTINYNFEKDEVVNLTVFNLLGEIVGMYNMKSEDKLYSLDLSHLASGVYTVKSESSSKPISVNRIILLK